MAIRKAKSMVSKSNAYKKREELQVAQKNIGTTQHSENTEEEDAFLAGFGSFDYDDDIDSFTTNSEVKVSEEKKESFFKNTKVGKDNEAVSSDQGTLIIIIFSNLTLIYITSCF